MPMRKKLDVIVCRSGKKGQTLAEDLMDKGICSAHLPTFMIQSKSFVSYLDRREITDVIFISVNAVIHFISKLDDHEKATLQTAKIWCVGEGTAKALKQYGLLAHCPKKANSESLLDLIENDIRQAQRFFLLVKGEGGRDFLETELKCHYECFTVACYSRQYCSKEHLLNTLSEKGYQVSDSLFPDLILFSSFDGLKAAMPVFDFYPSWKQNSTITVTNARMHEWAKAQGFAKLILIDSYDNTALITLSEKILAKGKI